jgi:CubicO group peptidase (beta-lactamase class C family)
MSIEDELASTLADAATAHHVPGATAGILVGDDCWTAAFGITNVDHPAPVTPASMFQVGSITKTFTSAAVMLLVQEGKLALEDPVALHLPELGPATGLDFDAITVERALSHQLGFDGDHLFVRREWDDLTVLEGARRHFPAGSGFSYNNAGFSIAGAVVAAISGQAFEEFVRERLLLPLGMPAAGFTADEVITYPVMSPHVVLGDQAYVIRGAGWQPGWELGPVDRPAGGLIASVEHLMTWCRFQATGLALDGSEILTPESLERLHTPVVNADALDDIALDWFVRDVDGVRSIGHGGVTAGYVSDLIIVPQRSFACVSLTNATNGASVNDAVRRWALQRFAGIDERDPEPDATLTIDADRFTGQYVHSFAMLNVDPGAAPGTVTVTQTARGDVDGGWQPPLDPPYTLAFFTDDHAVTVDPPGPPRVARFGFDDDGRVTWMTWSGRRAPRVD